MVAQRIDVTSALRPGIVPRDYQQDAIAAVVAARNRGLKRALLALPTGAGKTVVFGLVIAHFLAEGGRVLVLAHRDELIQQAVAKLREILGDDADIGIVKAESDRVDARIVVASVQTLARDERLRRMGHGFVLVVIDEAHHAAADSYLKILDHFGIPDGTGPFLLGVTATPDRGDGVGLDAVFEEIVYELGILDLIRRGYLVDLRGLQVAIAADFGALHTRAGDVVDGEAARMLLDADAPTHVAAAYREHARDRTGLLFGPTVAVAHALAESLRGEGIAAEAIDANTESQERRRVLQRFAAGDIQALANCSVLVEGYDNPRVDCVAIARPTKSRALYAQMIGRGTRPYPGKRDCLILDVVGASVRHDLVTAPELFGLPPGALAAKTVGEAVAEQEAIEEDEAAAGELMAATVDLFRQRPANWVPTRTGRFVLPTGAGTLVLRPHFGDRWDVLHVPVGTSPIVLAAGLSLGFAQGIAEDHARTLGASVLVARDAGWRVLPPTDKQRYRLRLLGVPTRDIRTRGEASDAITAALAAEVA